MNSDQAAQMPPYLCKLGRWEALDSHALTEVKVTSVERACT